MLKKVARNALSPIIVVIFMVFFVSNVFASPVDVTSVVDVIAPLDSVTLDSGNSDDITINMEISGKLDGTATFELFTEWTLKDGVFTGSVPKEFTINPQSGSTTTMQSTPGKVIVDASQPAGTFSFDVSVFDITNSNTDGAKLAGGTSATYQVTVNERAISDTVPPVITKPVDITVEATGPSGAEVTFTASAVDAVDGPVTVIAAPASGSMFPLGSTTVSLTTTDDSGNSASETFLVTVLDTTPPELTVPENITVNAVSAAGALVNFDPATAIDLVDQNVEITYSSNSGTWFPIGTTTVQVTAMDDFGNKATGSFTVTVKYDFEGFFKPVDMTEINIVKAGRAIPIKFSLGGDMGLDIMAAGYPKVVPIMLETVAETDGAETAVTAGGSMLTYDPIEDQYIFVWKTDKSWAGMSKKLIVMLQDGTTHEAVFQFKEDKGSFANAAGKDKKEVPSSNNTNKGKKEVPSSNNTNKGKKEGSPSSNAGKKK